jgi:hypothetical protein
LKSHSNILKLNKFKCFNVNSLNVIWSNSFNLSNLYDFIEFNYFKILSNSYLFKKCLSPKGNLKSLFIIISQYIPEISV